LHMMRSKKTAITAGLHTVRLTDAKCSSTENVLMNHTM
jgi:hypothetical protein